MTGSYFLMRVNDPNYHEKKNCVKQKYRFVFTKLKIS